MNNIPFSSPYYTGRVVPFEPDRWYRKKFVLTSGDFVDCRVEYYHPGIGYIVRPNEKSVVNAHTLMLKDFHGAWFQYREYCSQWLFMRRFNHFTKGYDDMYVRAEVKDVRAVYFVKPERLVDKT